MKKPLKDKTLCGLQQEVITLYDYQIKAKRTDQNAEIGLRGLGFPLLGLFGEVGTLLSALKKKRRDQESFVGYTDAILEEFGDTLWYFSNIASRASLNLEVLAQKSSRELRDWDEADHNTFVTFSDIQAQKDNGGSSDSAQFEAALIELAGKVGLLLNDFHTGRIMVNRDALSAHLVDILRALIGAADIANIDLGLAASRNVEKIHSRWPERRIYPPLFDASFDSHEQLPRKIVMDIFEQKKGGRTVVVQQLNGVNIGSQITDNRMTDDGYRFHDAFHLAYAGILGWSPVLRALLKLKRKSQPKVDEVEDGARAILIEEGISTLVFHRAEHLNYFESIKSLDYSLLKLIPEFVRGYEVSRCPLWQWEKAILDGYAVFRKLRMYKRGTITADLEKHSVAFSELKQ